MSENTEQRNIKEVIEEAFDRLPADYVLGVGEAKEITAKIVRRLKAEWGVNLTFEELTQLYGESSSDLLVRVTNLEEIRMYVYSKCEIPVGDTVIAGTGWRTLFFPGNWVEPAKRVVLVCTEADYQAAVADAASNQSVMITYGVNIENDQFRQVMFNGKHFLVQSNRLGQWYGYIDQVTKAWFEDEYEAVIWLKARINYPVKNKQKATYE